MSMRESCHIKKAVLEADIEEERRMFYVGITRAREKLKLCSVKKLNNHETEISRFIREMNETGINPSLQIPLHLKVHQNGQRRSRILHHR